jgi:hypothetical protein
MREICGLNADIHTGALTLGYGPTQEVWPLLPNLDESLVHERPRPEAHIWQRDFDLSRRDGVAVAAMELVPR